MFKRFIVGLIAVILVVAGAAVGSASWWLWTAFGSAGAAAHDLGVISLTPASQSIVLDIDQVQVTVPGIPVKGRTELVAASEVGGPATIIAGSMSAVDEFLAGSHYTAASLVNGEWVTADVPGVRPLVVAPSEGLAIVDGKPAVLDLSSGHPETIAVVAHPEAGEISLLLRYVVPDVQTIVIASALFAALLLGAGLLLIWVAIFAMRPRGRHE